MFEGAIHTTNNSSSSIIPEHTATSSQLRGCKTRGVRVEQLGGRPPNFGASGMRRLTFRQEKSRNLQHKRGVQACAPPPPGASQQPNTTVLPRRAYSKAHLFPPWARAAIFAASSGDSSPGSSNEAGAEGADRCLAAAASALRANCLWACRSGE